MASASNYAKSTNTFARADPDLNPQLGGPLRIEHDELAEYKKLVGLTRKFSKTEIDLFRKHFQTFECDRGVVARTDMPTLMRACGLKVSDSESIRIVDSAKVESVHIPFSEFLVILGKSMLTPAESYQDKTSKFARKAAARRRKEEEEEIRRAFSVFDKGGHGRISTKILRNAMVSLGEALTEDEVEHIITDADPKGVAMVEVGDFVNYLCYGSATQRPKFSDEEDSDGEDIVPMTKEEEEAIKKNLAAGTSRS